MQTKFSKDAFATLNRAQAALNIADAALIMAVSETDDELHTARQAVDRAINELRRLVSKRISCQQNCPARAKRSR